MIGEIRDAETIEIAIKAALTGHLVLTTLHTNDAAQSITRIVTLGVDNFLVASTGLLYTAQRLARKLCLECRVPAEHEPKELFDLQFRPEDLEGATFFRAHEPGCARCFKGYRGRFALMESLRFSEPVKNAVVAGADALEIKRIAMENGMVTLRRAGIRNVARGITSLAEMLRVTMAD
jgi:type IV pilus assembly protein PilB